MAKVLHEQRQEFLDKFGREPGPDDQVFFDMPHSEQIEHEIGQAMKKVGIDAALIYAFEKTGRWSQKTTNTYCQMLI